MHNPTDVLTASFSKIAASCSSAKHPRATLALVHATREIRQIVPGSYESRYACGEVISLTLSGREGDAEVFCDECAKKEGLKWQVPLGAQKFGDNSRHHEFGFIDGLDEAVRKWRFECTSGILTALVNSKLVRGGLGASIVLTLFHEPLTALASAGSVLALEVGRTALEIRKQQFAMRDIARANPVSYISYANEKLGTDG